MSAKTFLISTVFIFSTLSFSAQTADDQNQQVAKEYFNSLKGNKKENYSPNELIVRAALLLLNTPYVSGILDRNSEEKLVVNLRESDCMTFVENCLALSRAAQYISPDYNYFIRELKRIRYRNGIVNGYTSRLHYTMDWIYDNTIKGEIEDITCTLGGKKFKPNVYYMSSHPDLYAGLKDNPRNTEQMTEIESQINQRTYCYIPRDEINEKISLIKSGDIICFTTGLPGLDVSHWGIAYYNKGQPSFIHASAKMKKVIINPESISDYCLKNKRHTGIVVLRQLPINNSTIQ